jgi:hypothetical protein
LFIHITKLYLPRHDTSNPRNMSPPLPQLQSDSSESNDMTSLSIKIKRVKYLLERTGRNLPEDHPETSNSDPGREIENIRQALRDRFGEWQSTYSSFTGFDAHKSNDEKLKEFSSGELKMLRWEHRDMSGFTIRNRVFDLNDSQHASFSLPPPALPFAEPATL